MTSRSVLNEKGKFVRGASVTGLGRDRALEVERSRSESWTVYGSRSWQSESTIRLWPVAGLGRVGDARAIMMQRERRNTVRGQPRTQAIHGLRGWPGLPQ